MIKARHRRVQVQRQRLRRQRVQLQRQKLHRLPLSHQQLRQHQHRGLLLRQGRVPLRILGLRRSGRSLMGNGE